MGPRQDSGKRCSFEDFGSRINYGAVLGDIWHIIRPQRVDVFTLLKLIIPLSNRGHVHGHPCGEGAGLLGPRWGRTRDSTLIRELFTGASGGTHS